MHKTQQTLEMDLVNTLLRSYLSNRSSSISSEFSVFVYILSLERNMLPNCLALRY